MQGLGEQRQEPLSEESLVAAYAVGRHFAESMRIPMQESSDVILGCTPFSPEVARNHLGYLHAGVRVVNNAWTDDAGEEVMELLLEAMAEAGCNPPPPQVPCHLTRISPEVIQASPTSQPMRCDSDPKMHLPVSLMTKVHPMMHVLCTWKGAQRRP